MKSITALSHDVYRVTSKIMAMLLLAITMMIAFAPTGYAAIDVYDFDSEQQEAQYQGLIAEFRCPKCQNQNLAGSDAPIAQDLKQKTYDMVKDGRSDAEIRDYMQERYGDFISYKPPIRPSTWVLWFFPPLLLIVILGGWFWRTQRRHQRIEADGGPSAKVRLSSEEQAKLDRLLASRSTTDRPPQPTETSKTAKSISETSSQDQSKGAS